MHEAGVVRRALDVALHAAPYGAGAPRGAALIVTDPVHVAAPSAELHLEAALRERGLEGVPIRITVRPVTCVSCGSTTAPDPSDPFCASCGWPLPRTGGPSVEIALDW